jgi:murein DD-endopeptidase MepM/ murein hydrolase activator NlpD
MSTPSTQECPLDLIDRFRRDAAGFRSRHARSTAAVVLAVLGGFGAVAIAVAPLAPDAAALPQRLVIESVAVADVNSQLEALASHDLQLTRSEVTRAGDSINSLLLRLGVADAEAAAFLRQDRATRRAIDGRAQRLVQALAREDGGLIELVVRYPAENAEQVKTHFTRLTVSRFDGRWFSRVDTAKLSSEVRLGSGTVRSTLFAATDEAKLPDPVATQLTELFSGEVDFHRELHKGDTFSVVYEAVTADGEPIAWNQGTGRVLAAEFVNGGRTHQAIWFDGAGKGAYYDAQGRSRKRVFLASPMEFSRITSGFAMRMHPTLQRMRAHLGVDYAAPTGTPVRSVGDGVVDFAGWQNGYGNVVQIKHGNERSTLYAHLSRIDVRVGQRVEQGARVGEVGATGWATGPHLHFEFRVAGVYQDPQLVAKAAEQAVLDASARSQFTDVARTVQVKLDVAESMVGGRSTFE